MERARHRSYLVQEASCFGIGGQSKKWRRPVTREMDRLCTGRVFSLGFGGRTRR